MADRVLRGGSRLGAVSYETDRNHDLAPRQVARYRTDNGEEFDVPFADDAEIPPHTWLCRNGMEGTLIEGDAPEPKKRSSRRARTGTCCWSAGRSRNSRSCSRSASTSSRPAAAATDRFQRVTPTPRARSMRPRIPPHSATLNRASRMLEPLIFD